MAAVVDTSTDSVYYTPTLAADPVSVTGEDGYIPYIDVVPTPLVEGQLLPRF